MTKKNLACSRCGGQDYTFIGGNNYRCNRCGHSVQLRACPGCGALVEVGQTACHHCGIALPPMLPATPPVLPPTLPDAPPSLPSQTASSPLPPVQQSYSAPQPPVAPYVPEYIVEEPRQSYTWLYVAIGMAAVALVALVGVLIYRHKVVNAADEQLWAQIQGYPTSEAINRYKAEFPKGNHIDELTAQYLPFASQLAEAASNKDYDVYYDIYQRCDSTNLLSQFAYHKSDSLMWEEIEAKGTASSLLEKYEQRFGGSSKHTAELENLFVEKAKQELKNRVEYWIRTIAPSKFLSREQALLTADFASAVRARDRAASTMSGMGYYDFVQSEDESNIGSDSYITEIIMQGRRHATVSIRGGYDRTLFQMKMVNNGSWLIDDFYDHGKWYKAEFKSAARYVNNYY